MAQPPIHIVTLLYHWFQVSGNGQVQDVIKGNYYLAGQKGWLKVARSCVLAHATLGPSFLLSMHFYQDKEARAKKKDRNNNLFKALPDLVSAAWRGRRWAAGSTPTGWSPPTARTRTETRASPLREAAAGAARTSWRRWTRPAGRSSPSGSRRTRTVRKGGTIEFSIPSCREVFRIIFREFPCPAWAGASCSSGPQVRGTPLIESKKFLSIMVGKQCSSAKSMINWLTWINAHYGQGLSKIPQNSDSSCTLNNDWFWIEIYFMYPNFVFEEFTNQA